ncbi:MAG: hypothetical protein K9L22_09495 [Methylococcaceae bacterium]|nr:hypothetical protein [Methylococcaceae bacterium]
MQDQLAEILFYIKGTLKYKWVIIITAWLICIAGWSFVSTMPDKYQSEAKVNVDSRTMLRPLLRGMAMQANTQGLVQVMQQLMFTRPNLEKIAQLGDLDINSKDEAEKQEIIAELKAAVTITGGRDDIFTIAYEATDAQQSQDIVHAVLTVFSEQAQQRGTADTGSAQQFIEEQIREYEARLKNSEKARENFKRINSGLLPEEGGGQLSELAGIKTQIEATQMALGEANSRWTVLNRQISEVIETDEDWGVTDVVMGQSTPEDAQISELTTRMNELLLKYTTNHPDVLSLKATIQDLQKSKEERLASMPRNTNIISAGAMANPYIQTLKIALNNAEAERASLQSRMSLLNRRMRDIRQGMDTRLSIETEMQNLDRDYSIVKSNYLKLIESREQAAMTEKADTSQGVLRFKIVDAPSKPLSPSSPKRGLFNSVVLAAGAGIGFVVAFLLYFIRPTFMSTRQVRMITGLPVLGSVTVQIQESDKSNKINIILFWFLVIGLLLVYLLIVSNIVNAL